MTDRDCPFCGTTMRTSGKLDRCPSCGAARPANWQVRPEHARRVVERAERMQAKLEPKPKEERA